MHVKQIVNKFHANYERRIPSLSSPFFLSVDPVFLYGLLQKTPSFRIFRKKDALHMQRVFERQITQRWEPLRQEPLQQP